MFISGTKIMIQKKTTGQAIKNLSNHLVKKSVFQPIFKNTMKAETKVLVQNDMIDANIINLLFFIILYIIFLSLKSNILAAQKRGRNKICI